MTITHDDTRPTGVWFYGELVKRPPLADILASWLSPASKPLLVKFTTKQRFIAGRKVFSVKITTMGKHIDNENILIVDAVWEKADGEKVYLAAEIDLNNKRKDWFYRVDALGLQFEFVE